MALTSQQQSTLSGIKKKAEAIQTSLNESIASGQIKSASKSLATPTPQKTVSGSLKDLSIGLAQQNKNTAPTSGSGSIKDLSIGLAKGNSITQADITRAQSGGASLASLSSPVSTPTTGGAPSTTSTPTSNQTGVDGKGYYSRYSKNEAPVVETPNYEDIQKKLAKDAQKEINSLYKYQKSLLDEQLGVNQQEERATASVSTLTGLAGSSEANVQQQKTTEKGQQANKQIMDAVNTQVQSVLAKVRSDAMQQYQYERTQASQDAVTNATLTEKARKTATENIAALSQSGVTNDGYKEADPEGYAYLAKQMGGEDVVKAMFTLNRPQETILDKKIEGGKYIISFQNPLDGKIRIETVDLGLPPQYTKTIDAGNRILAIPDGWTGDPAELITINKGLTPSQETTVDISTGVSPEAQNIIDQINLGASLDDLVKGTSNAAQNLRNEVIAGLNAQGGLTTKSYEILKDGKEVVDAMLNSKAYEALGGYSSILGGQYSTAYGDAMAQAAQLQAILARDNLGLLKGAMSDKDLAFIQAMSSGFEGQGTQSEAFIKERFESIQTKLADKISKVPTETGSSSGTLTSPDGTQEVNIADLTPEQIQEARDAGWNE